MFFQSFISNIRGTFLEISVQNLNAVYSGGLFGSVMNSKSCSVFSNLENAYMKKTDSYVEGKDLLFGLKNLLKFLKTVPSKSANA